MGQEIVVGVIVSLLIFIVSSLIFTLPRKYIIRIYLKARKFFRKKPKTSKQQSDAQDPNKSPEEAQLDALFGTACKFVEKASSLSDEQQLTLYGLYKQATVGECTKPKPKASDIIELKKWEAWIEQKGKTNAEAKKEYVNSVESFIPGAKVSAEGGSETSEENGDDDLFMTDEEYRQRKEKNNKTSFGMKFSRPTMGFDEMNSEPVQENEADISKFFKLINKEDLKGIEKAIKAGFDLYKEDNAGMKAIHYAIENEKESVVALLCEHYTDLNTPDKAGMTPLHYAVAHEDEAIIELLLKKNVDVNKTDDEGECPLDLANAKLKKFIESCLNKKA